MIDLATERELFVSFAGDGLGASGDFVHSIDRPDGRRAFFVGDVAGRGAGLSDAAESLRFYLRFLINDGCGPERALEACNRFFCSAIAPCDIPFATLFLALADVDGTTLTYASAGHETALLFDAHGNYEELASSGPLIGLFDAVTTAFPERKIPFRDGDVLVVVTDGVTDARPRPECLEFFGTSGVARAVARARQRNDEIAAAVFQAAIAHSGGTLLDDASVMVLAR